jgi:hypothetical protein
MVMVSSEVRGWAVGKIRGVSVGGSGVSVVVEVELGGGTSVSVAVDSSVKVAEGDSGRLISVSGVELTVGLLQLARRNTAQHSKRGSRFISFIPLLFIKATFEPGIEEHHRLPG